MCTSGVSYYLHQQFLFSEWAQQFWHLLIYIVVQGHFQVVLVILAPSKSNFGALLIAVSSLRGGHGSLWSPSQIRYCLQSTKISVNNFKIDVLFHMHNFVFSHRRQYYDFIVAARIQIVFWEKIDMDEIKNVLFFNSKHS